MGYTLSQQISPKQKQSLKQTQRLMISPHMQQALQLLQLPVTELAQFVNEEVSQNPVIEVIEDNEDDPIEEEEEKEEEEKSLKFDENDLEILKKLDEDFRELYSQTEIEYSPRTKEDEKLQTYQESLIKYPTSLYEFLFKQAHECFGESNELTIANEIIGNINEKGLFEGSLEEIAKKLGVQNLKCQEILKLIQSFDPPGVGATCLQECLLLQLERKNKQESLAYRVIKEAFEELLRKKIPEIEKKLKCSREELQAILNHEIRLLDLHPGLNYSNKVVQSIIPDIAIRQDGDLLVVQLHEDSLPPLKLNPTYLKLLEQEGLSKEEKEFIKEKIGSAKWLMRNLYERNSTLERITQNIAEKQKDFFVGVQGHLTSLTMKTVAQDLNLHESTIARSVANKYVDTPKGIFPLRYFFGNAFLTDQGEDLSSKTVKEYLMEFIKNEDKRRPLSDQALSHLLKSKGITCARRTVAKYRSLFNMGNALQRKNF